MTKRMFAIVLIVLTTTTTYAAIPLIINHQGFVNVSGAAYTGTGFMKFGIHDGANYIWTNDGSKLGEAIGSLSSPNIPTAAAEVSVVQGLYALGLGDTAQSGTMVVLPSSAFDTELVYLRVFFNDGVQGYKALGDQQLTSTAYSYRAAHADTSSKAEFMIGSLRGGVISNNLTDTAHDLDITEIWCADDTNAYRIHASAMTKRIDATWVAGTNAGGLAPGETMPSTREIMYIYAIGDQEGVFADDFMISDDPTNPSLPTGYELKRLIGGRRFDGAADSSDTWSKFATVGEGDMKWVYYEVPLACAGETDISSFNTWTTLNTKGDNGTDDLVPLATARVVRFNCLLGGTVTANNTGIWVAESSYDGSTNTHGFKIASATRNSSDRVDFAGVAELAVSETGEFQLYISQGGGGTYTYVFYVRAYLETL